MATGAAVGQAFHIGLVFLDQSLDIPELTRVRQVNGGFETNSIFTPVTLTAPSAYSTLEGGLAGWSESDVRHAIRFEVERIYREVSSVDASLTLGVNFYTGMAPASASGRRLNVVIGANSFVEYDYGAGLLGAAFDEANYPNDSFIAAAFADNLDSVGGEPGIELDTAAKAINNIAGTIAHEIGHAFGLQHEAPGTAAPYSIMANGATGLTMEQRLTERRFSAASAAQLASALPLYQRGDFNMDGDVDVFQIDGLGDAQILTSRLGATQWASFGEGDANSDGDVDVFQFDGRGDAQLLIAGLASPAAASVYAFAASIPEPSAALLAAIAWGGLLHCLGPSRQGPTALR